MTVSVERLLKDVMKDVFGPSVMDKCTRVVKKSILVVIVCRVQDSKKQSLEIHPLRKYICAQNDGERLFSNFFSNRKWNIN